MDIAILVVEESNYEAGEIAFSQFHPDLVILEMELQAISGIKLLQQIKSTSPFTVVAIFTNFSSVEYKVNCIENGADYFFDKCKNYKELLGLIRTQAQLYELE